MKHEISASAPGGRLRVSGKFFRRGGDGTECFVKAVTFGPFPKGIFPGDEAREQFERIKNDLGANAVRFYEPPSPHWLDDLEELGLMAFVTLPWNQHVDFLSSARARREAEIRVRALARRFRQHAAVAGCFVGNEIEAALVRYLGPAKVARFIGRLIDVAREQCPDPLFSYANYPTTEYLIVENQDFIAFNVYLEERSNYRDYLYRLQSLAGNLPVMVSEFGCDSRSHGLAGQAMMHAWQAEEACAAGFAGTTLFSWSDHWSRGGETIETWDFGLTNREGHSKPALQSVRDRWKGVSRAIEGAPLERWPRFSVIVCTYRGASRIGAALDSLLRLDYPDYEIIVVNDGNDDAVRDLVQPLERVRHLGVPHGGLSKARNLGARVAEGEILAYTDDDCVIPPDWLSWLARALASPERPDCVGGPNIAPPPQNPAQARLNAAPGSPAHVLTGDRTAEHVPGCNLAVKKRVFEAVGGFNPVFRSAGDDVDFCWRLLDAGFCIGFHPGAFVWHDRRADVGSYLRQQRGYGLAEALLKPLHRRRFNGFGGAMWKGAVYEGAPFLFSQSSRTVSHGVFGRDPYQPVYPDQRLGLGAVFTHVFHVGMVMCFFAGSIFYPVLAIPACWGLALSAGVLVSAARRADLPREFDTVGNRLAVAGLTIAQGLTRSAVRAAGSLPRLQPLRLLAGWAVAMLALPRPRFENSLALKFWSDRGVTREELHREMIRKGAAADLSGESDFLLTRGPIFRTSLLTATEYHEKQGRLTHARLRFRLNNGVFLALLCLALALSMYLGKSWWPPLTLIAWNIIEWWGKAYAGCAIVCRAASRCGLEPAE